ncbi:MAG TPA: nuclear transport factor 2 family protein [Puia sp.]|jgi:hypothetical protein|nr:nuclear transport factor 2 family protein [Puia sp.]
MRTMKISSLEIAAVLIWLLISVMIIETAHAQSNQDSSINKKLFNELIHKDSVIFNAAFNTCNIADIETVLDENFKFYPDNGSAVYNSFQDRFDFINGIKKNFCDNKTTTSQKMRREIDMASVQVLPLTDNEVLQTGTQRFYMLNTGEQDKLVEVSKFTRTWQRKNGGWKLSKEFDAFANTYSNHPQDSLYYIIQHQDSLLFNAYNTHDLAKIKTYFTDDLEFYHDKGGLTNYVQNMQSFKGNFEKNNGITRSLVSGSLEVYPVKDFGAMEIGEHKFCHEENGKQDCGTFKFAMVWKKTNEGWKISRVISYGH